MPTPANANFVLGCDAVRGQLKVLYPVTRWSRGRNPIGRNAMKTRENESAANAIAISCRRHSCDTYRPGVYGISRGGISDG